MFILAMVLAFQNPPIFAKPVERPRVRVYIHPSTFDEAFAPFTRAPVKCVPHDIDAGRRQYLQEATEQKTPDEIEQYLKCYSTDSGYRSYTDQFREMINEAEKDFGVDPSLMKCLLLRESQWKPAMVSCTCATGLGQQTSENMASVKQYLRATLNGPSWTRFMSKARDIDPDYSSKCSGQFTRGSEETDHKSPFYKSAMSNLESGCGATPPNCHVFYQDDRRCPAASIAASAAYIKYIDSIVRKSVNCGQIEPWQIPDSRIAIALAYNAGEGTFKKAIKKANDANETISINFLDGAEVSEAKMNEMREHYRALRFCLHAGESGPPSKRDPWKTECVQRKPSPPAQQQQMSNSTIRR